MITCTEALDQYYKEHIALKAVARRRAEYAIDHLKDFFEDEPLQNVDIPLCREYRGFRLASDSTVRRELGVLQAAANHARKWRRITLDKMPSIELPAEGPSKTLWLYKDELVRLLAAAEEVGERPFRFCQLAYHTASRKAAIETLEWEQVDLEARRINLQKENAPVTKKRRPIVPVSVPMAEILKDMKRRTNSPYVLGERNSIVPLFGKAAKLAGLSVLPKRGLRGEGRISPHVLRHSRATHLLQDGKSIFAVANLLGDLVTTVQKVYGHACPDYMDEVLS